MGGESVPAGMVRIGRTRGSQAWWALCASRADAPRWRGFVRARHLREVRRPTRKGWRSNELGSGRPRRRCRAGPCAVRPAAKRIGCAAPIEETQRRSPLIDDNSFATWAYLAVAVAIWLLVSYGWIQQRHATSAALAKGKAALRASLASKGGCVCQINGVNKINGVK